jgi:predicted DsbA family dithiol-disulfide isomerase
MQIDIWSDVVCPWCYIGKRRFETALASFDEAARVTVQWRAFELDPHAPAVRDGDPAGRLATKYGTSIEQAARAQDRLSRLAEAEGLHYRLATARSGNTFDAHRLIKMAAGAGLQDAMEERLLSAYLCEEKAIGDRATLVDLAAEVGIDAALASEILAGDAYADAVRNDEEEATRREITGVPFFLIDGRFGVPGAQESDTLLAVLRRAWTRRQDRSA